MRRSLPSRTAALASHLARWARGRDVGIGYAVVVVGTAVALALAAPGEADRVVASSSTNLVNLRQHPPYVLVVSAFVEPTVAQLWIVVPLVWALGALQYRLGRAAAVVTVVLGHVGATLFVATILTAGIAKGRISLAEATATDVGVSYGLVAVVGLLTADVPGRWRPRIVIAVTVVLAGVLVTGRSFTDLGHLVAWALGLALSVLVMAARRAAVSTSSPTGLRTGS